jgi:hypothetical protein
VQLALMSGILVQWLIDPGQAPAERDIAEGILTLADHLTGLEAGHTTAGTPAGT